MKLLEREPLLAQLASLLMESRRGRGRLALISGEAGIGKTALVDEFCSNRALGVRVLWGSCDAVVPARPFAPLRDIADLVGGQLREALDAADRDRVFAAFLALLRRPAGPATLVVFEDLHWADEATLDLLRVAGRRLRSTRMLIIATYRDDEVGSEHPLRLALGDFPPGTVVEIKVPPLSVGAVQEIARDSGLDGVELHGATGGNPFFVTEVVAARGAEVPVTIRDAVLARIAHLSPRARRVVRAASVFGQPCEPDLLHEVAEQDASALDEPVARGVLRVEAGLVGFRHDLARRAVLDALGTSERVALHRRALAALRRIAAGADPARLAHHAVGAGDARAVIDLAPAAGRRAAELGSHREAVAHFAAAMPFKHRLDVRARAELLEVYARECRFTDDVTTALRSLEEALECWRRLENPAREGTCLLEMSMTMYHAGKGDRALHVAESAVSILESIPPPGHSLALALATVAQRRMNAGKDDAAALAWGRRAFELAERLHDEPIAIHALTTIGVTEIYMRDEAGWVKLEESLRRARAAGLAEDITRALINLVETASDMRRYDLADQWVREAIAYVDDHDLVLYHRLLLGRRAELALERGDWDVAAEQGKALLDQGATATQIQVRALTLVGRLRSRRGDPDPWSPLDEALAQIGPGGELQELLPLRAARAEAAWLDGDMARAREEASLGLPLALQPPRSPSPWWWAELAFWAWRSGGLKRLPDGAPEPYRLHASGRHREAAVAWRLIGSPYNEAVALADSHDEQDLRRALEILHELGARPMMRAVTARLRASGAHGIPRGPRLSTRRNPAGLTARETEVLGLLAVGLRNADIAERLVVTSKTVDHHVSAILRKLGVPNRAAAKREALRLGLKYGELQSPR